MFPVPDEPAGVPAENPKKSRQSFGKKDIFAILLLLLLAGIFFGVPAYMEHKAEKARDLETKKFEEESKKRQREYAAEKKAAEEAYRKQREEEREKYENEYKTNCAILEKMMTDLDASKLEAEGLDISYVCYFPSYGEEVPEAIINAAEKLQNDTPFPVSLVLFRPRPHPENLHDFPVRRCMLIGIAMENDRDWSLHLFAMWDTKDLSRYALGNENIKKMLEERKSQKPQPEYPK